MRYVMIRYASAATDWQPKFALRRLGYFTVQGLWKVSAELVNAPAKEGTKNQVLTFRHPAEALEWLQVHAQRGDSLEWEGTVY